MEEYSNITPDRDRAFDTAHMNELLSLGKTMLAEAIRISSDMEKAITGISTIYAAIDGEHKNAALGSDIENLTGTLIKDCYQDTMDEMDTLLTRLISDVPSNDSSLAGNMDSLGEVLKTIETRIADLKGLLEAGDINISYSEFTQRLEDIKAGWENTSEDLADILKDIESDMYGISAAAVQYSSDPVNLSTGNFVYDHEDMKIGGEIPLAFHRYYNAKDSRKGSMGRSFRHNNELALEKDKEKEKITICMGDGQRKQYRKKEDGSWQGAYSATETLTEEEKGYLLTEADGKTYRFDRDGKLIRTEDRNKKGTAYTYDAENRLACAETDNGSKLTYAYNKDGQLTAVTDHTGRTTELTYERKKLVSVKTPQGSTYTYRYAKNGRIEEITNPRNIKTVKNTYDDKRRITRQEFPDGGSMTYEYKEDMRRVELTERNGSRITYINDGKYRNTDILYEDGTKEHFEYNGKNQKILYTDRNGNTSKMAYDNRGNLTQVINALGEKANLTYNSKNNLISLKINGKEKIHNSYDTDGNLTGTRQADGSGTKITRDGRGRPVRIENAEKDITEITYDERGNIKTIQDGTGIKTGYMYDSLNRAVRTTDGNGNATDYEYNKAGKITRVTNPLGKSRTYSYNESGKVTKVTDYDGFAIKAEYNSIGKISRITDKENNKTEYTYDAMWNLSGITQADGGRIQNKYDGNNRICEQMLPEGGILKYEYDGNGNRTAATDGNGNKTTSIYDALNRVIKTVDPAGAETDYTYDTDGNLTCIKDTYGSRTYYAYDEKGHCIQKTDAMGNRTTYKYDAVGNLTETTYPNKSMEQREYRAGRLYMLKKPDGSSMRYDYDGNGNCIRMENGRGENMCCTYDSLNRVETITNPGGGVTRYTYDATGNITKKTDPLGNKTTYAYTPNGNLAMVTDAMGNRTRYAYDAMNRLVKAERIGENTDNPESGQETQTTGYKWNMEGRVTGMTDPLGAEETYAYDPNGKMTDKWDRDGNHTEYRYDGRGLMTEILYADGNSITYGYDALRRLEEIKDSTGTTKITNDALGRITSVTDPQGKTVSYEWGSMNKRTRLTYPDGKETEYRYNTKGLLEEMRTPNGSIQYHYDESGRLKEKQLPNGITTAYTYNRTGRLEQLSHTGKGHTEKYSYSYDAAGNKTGANRHRPDMEADSGSYGYIYDSLMRLTEVTKDGEPLRSYSYDTYGNRTGKTQYGSAEPVMTTYRYNAGNQLIKQTDPEKEQTYFYDKRGNLTAVKSGEELIKAYTYDAANLMSGSYGTADGTKKHAEYRYNGLGQRVSQSIYGNVTAGAMTESLQGKTETPESRITYILDLTRPYHNLLQTEENAAEKKQSFYWDAGVAAMEEKGEAGYYLLDDLGSPMELMDETGTVMESYGFDEFGCNILPGKEPSAINTGTVEHIQPFGFTGYQTDKVGGLYFAQARRYDADAGRFVSEDKIKGNAFLPISINAYLYCRMNPMKYIDPSGNDYIIFWSYGRDDVEDFEKYYNNYYVEHDSDIYVADATDAIDYPADGKTRDWTYDMWDKFNERSSFARAAYTRRDELIEMGVPEDEIHVIGVDRGDDIVNKWNSETQKYDSVQQIEFYSHGEDGHPVVYYGSNGYFTYNLTLLNNDIKWASDEYTSTPMMFFHGCNTADDKYTQKIADYFGVPVQGNTDSASFSHSQETYKEIDTWGTEHNIYLGVYGNKWKRKFPWLFGTAYRDYGKTYYPKCME